MQTNKLIATLLAIAAVLYLLNFRLSASTGASTGGWTVYGTNGCGWTRKQLASMKSKNIKHKFVDCDKDDCGDITAFPTLKNVDGTVVVGFKDL